MSPVGTAFRITRRRNQWTLYHRGDEGWEAARTTEGGTGPVGFAIYVGGDAPDSHLVRFDDLRITSDRANPPAAPVPSLNERLTAIRWAFAEGRDDHVLSTVSELLLTLSRTTPDTALVDRAWELMLDAGPRQVGRGGRGDRRAPARADTLVTRRDVGERAFGLMLHGHQKAGVLLTERSLAMRAATGLPDERLVAVALHRMGNALFALGDYRRGMECYTRAQPIYAAFEGVHDRVHSVEANRALMHLLLGELGEARRIWEPLIADFEAHHRDRHSLLATNYMNLGELYLRMGEDPRLAGRMFERGMELRLAAGHTRQWLGDPLMMLAGTYTALGEPARALAILDSLAKEHVVRDDNSNIGDVEMHHAEALLMVGRLDEAERAAGKARDLLAGAWDFDHARLCDANQVLAKVLIARGDWPRALAAAESALVFARRWLPDFTRSARALLLGRWPPAPAVATTFASAIKPSGACACASWPRAGRRGGIPHRSRPRRLGVAAEVMPPGPDAARVMLDAIIRSRALILDLRVARLPFGGADSVGQALRGRFARACTRLANLAMRPRARSGAAEDRQEIEDARTERRRAEQALAEYSAPFARQRSRGSAGLDEVLSAIPEGAALVSFVRLTRGPLQLRETVEPATPPSSSPPEGRTRFTCRSGPPTAWIAPSGAGARRSRRDHRPARRPRRGRGTRCDGSSGTRSRTCWSVLARL
jgi:tetratricopeptide (TPR) repeat protein